MYNQDYRRKYIANLNVTRPRPYMYANVRCAFNNNISYMCVCKICVRAI